MTSATESSPILVIGATGKVGRRVAGQLTAAGLPVRAASRSSAARFDWQDQSSWRPALAGATAAYVMPAEIAVDLEPFIAAAEEEGIGRLVLLSARQPAQGGDGVVPAFESAVTASAIPSVILRPSWFVQNFTEGVFAQELESGALRLPVGSGREPFIDADDIAAVAVAALTSSDHDGKTYELSGPELLTFEQAVQRLAHASGRESQFLVVDPQQWAVAAAAFLPAPVVELLGNLFAGIRGGDNAFLSTGVQEVLGRAPRTFEEALAGRV